MPSYKRELPGDENEEQPRKRCKSDGDKESNGNEICSIAPKTTFLQELDMPNFDWSSESEVGSNKDSREKPPCPGDGKEPTSGAYARTTPTELLNLSPKDLATPNSAIDWDEALDLRHSKNEWEIPTADLIIPLNFGMMRTGVELGEVPNFLPSTFQDFLKLSKEELDIPNRGIDWGDVIIPSSSSSSSLDGELHLFEIQVEESHPNASEVKIERLSSIDISFEKDFDFTSSSNLFAFDNYTIQKKAELCKMLSRLTPESLLKKVVHLNRLITSKVHTVRRLQDNVLMMNYIKLMNILFCANIYREERQENINNFITSQSTYSETYQIASKLGFGHFDITKSLLPFRHFVNEELCNIIEVRSEYDFYDLFRSRFSILYYPFVLRRSFRTEIFYIDLSNEYNDFSYEDHPDLSPFLFINVRREHIISDTISFLYSKDVDEPSSFKRDIQVKFEGEAGQDSGGLTKEFFNLFITKIFEEKYGLFVATKNKTHYWLDNSNLCNLLELKIIGVMLGMAINNKINLNTLLPPVLYKKLMGLKGTLEDLKDLDSVLWQSLHYLLDNEADDIGDILCWTFEVPLPNRFENNLLHELKKDGSKIPVTQSNKKEFVDLYVDFLLNKNIQIQFNALKKGFHSAINSTFLKRYILPDELESLLCGERVIDFQEFEETVNYEGCNEDHEFVKNFWEVVHAFTLEQKRSLLKFITSSECVPIGGINELDITIIRNGPDSERLPTAQTCSNSLLLPAYSTKKKLKQKLVAAIANCEGFGLM